MDKKLICENKYELGYHTISLPVELKNLPDEIKVAEYTLYLPSPFHVSLVYIGKIVKKYNINEPDFENKIIADFCEFSKTNEIKIINYTDEYKFVERDDKKTVVVMCEVSNLNKFFDLMNKKYGLNIKYQPTHITLYNKIKGEPGIYLMDMNDVKNFTKPIPNPIGHLLEPRS
jgi:hypothetical protein